MAGSGRISLLVSDELATLVQAIRGLDREVRAQNRKHTKQIADPAWKEEVRGRVNTRIETRVLSDSARTAVSDSNIILKSGGVGKVSSGTLKSALNKGAEFGADPNKMTEYKSRAGNTFTRRAGRKFKLMRRNGYVVYPAARAIIPRMASLWVQTTVRTIHEVFEKGGAR